MARVTLIAKERFYYDGRNVEMGEQFDAEEQDVSLLTHAVSPRAVLPEAQPVKLAAHKEDEPAPKPARYKRRDLEAEDS